MSSPRTCPECGAPLPTNDPQVLCVACLLKRGLETNTAGYTGEEPAARWTPPRVEEVAAKFPELEIQRLIGRGGMGAVYEARQKNLDRKVALKILPPEMGRDPAFAERFAREAQALAKLNHPHIVTIHEFGERGGGYYFVMEYVDGMNLRGILDAGGGRRILPREALAIVPQICEALQYAHDQGIVHRDIKPENILLNKQGQVKIADFGLAKLMGRTPAGGEKVMGTPQYMAPEQIERPAEVDHRADIYALGVVFYQMLTGELPVGRFALPSQTVQVDVRLDEVVLKALEREPEKRYQQASILKTRIDTIAGNPASAPAPGGAPPNAGTAAPRPRKKREIPVVGVRDGRRVIHWAGVALRIPLALIVTTAVVYAVTGAQRVDGFLPVFFVVISILLGIKCLVDWAQPIEKLPSLDDPPTDRSSPVPDRFWRRLVLALIFVPLGLLLVAAVISGLWYWSAESTARRNASNPPGMPAIPSLSEGAVTSGMSVKFDFDSKGWMTAEAKNVQLGKFVEAAFKELPALDKGPAPSVTGDAAILERVVTGRFKVQNRAQVIKGLEAVGTCVITMNEDGTQAVITDWGQPAMSSLASTQALEAGSTRAAATREFLIPVVLGTTRTGDLNIYQDADGRIKRAPETTSRPGEPGDGPVEVDFRIRSFQATIIEDARRRLPAGQHLTVEVYNDTRFGGGTSAIRKKIGQGTLESTELEGSDLACKALITRIDLRELPEGQMVLVRLLLETRHDVVLVPQSAIVRGSRGNNTGNSVFVMNSDQTVSMRSVKVGASNHDDSDIEITAGLNPGETVVIQGAEQLRNGDKVPIGSTKPASTPAAVPPEQRLPTGLVDG